MISSPISQSLRESGSSIPRPTSSSKNLVYEITPLGAITLSAVIMFV